MLRTRLANGTTDTTTSTSDFVMSTTWHCLEYFGNEIESIDSLKTHVVVALDSCNLTRRHINAMCYSGIVSLGKRFRDRRLGLLHTSNIMLEDVLRYLVSIETCDSSYSYSRLLGHSNVN